MNKEKRRQILERLREANPHPTTELEYSSPFELLVSVILSAQATDVSVNKAMAKLYPVANTPQAILNLGVDGLKDYIKTIGLYNAKAENIIKTCRILLEKPKSWLQNHPEKVKEYQRRYYQKKRAAAKKEKKIMLNPDIDKAKSLFRDPSKTAHLQWLLEHNRNKSKQYESR